MLGINTVKNLALSTAVLGNLAKGKSTVLNLDGFWRHSICVGVTAKLIAKRRNIDPKVQEEYFVAGLLHDIGKIPLNAYVPEDYILALSTTDREHSPLYVAETNTLGINHNEVGRLVAEAWKLDECVTDTIIAHHSVAEYAGQHEDVLFTVACSNIFANTFEIGFSGDRHPAPVPDVVFDRLGIDWDVLEEIEETISGEIEKAQIFLQVAK
jgi:putative nucleotidyltransferase with HDIG domain